MIRQIKMSYSDHTETHDDTIGENTMRSNMPMFFRTKHGKHETYTFYKGFIIVRNTVKFSQGPFREGKPERMTALYIYFPNLEGGRADTLHVSGGGNSVRSAKRRADEILERSSLGEATDNQNIIGE